MHVCVRPYVRVGTTVCATDLDFVLDCLEFSASELERIQIVSLGGVKHVLLRCIHFQHRALLTAHQELLVNTVLEGRHGWQEGETVCTTVHTYVLELSFGVWILLLVCVSVRVCACVCVCVLTSCDHMREVTGAGVWMKPMGS